MHMCDLGDMFQVRLDELLGDIEGVKMYINDILFLIKDSFKEHI